MQAGIDEGGYMGKTTKDLPEYWEGIIAVENEATGDGRLIEQGALSWDTPLPFRMTETDLGAHDGAVAIGRILTIERGEDGEIWAAGDFDHGSEAGREAARLVAEGIKTGVSVDLDSVESYLRVSEEAWESQNGEEVAEPERDEDGNVILPWNTDEMLVMSEARVRAATLVDIPAFKSATIKAAEEVKIEELAAIVASAAPTEPPFAWFEDPELEGPTALTVTDDGRIFGHLATWDTCHMGEPNGPGVCVTAPKSASDYAFFHTGVVKTSDGPLVPTGVLRFETSHASLKSSAAQAQAHYDHTGMAGADIHVGEDDYGIWVAGALRPGLTDEQVRTLRGSPLSGDWRYVKGALELVGALAVNLPGFPIPRPAALVASGEQQSLVAAGMLAPEAALERQFSESEEKYLRRLVDRERMYEQRDLLRRASRARDKARLARHVKQRRLEEM